MSLTIERRLDIARAHLERAQEAQRAKLASETRDPAFNELLLACAYLVDVVEALRGESLRVDLHVDPAPMVVTGGDASRAWRPYEPPINHTGHP